MSRYFLKRLAGAIPTLFIIVTAAFFLIRAAPGGPFDQEQSLPPEILANLERAYGLDLPVWALREQIRSAIHVVVQLGRLQDGSRKVTCITEVTGRTEDMIDTQDLFQFAQESVDSEGKVHGRFETMGHIPTFMKDLKAKGLQLDAHLFEKR